jgi:DNA-binding MarR family transcriptional regulator
MDVKRLKAFNQLAASHSEQFGTREDFKILLEIATAGDNGNCLTLKQLTLSASIPESTLKRRLSRLVRKNLVLKRMTTEDRRVHCYSLHDKTRQTLHDMIEAIRVFCWD